jgi:hypothetical protein
MKLNPDDASKWMAELSDNRVADLFRAIQAYSDAHPEVDGNQLRHLALSIAMSDLIDVFAFCVPPKMHDRNLKTLIDGINEGVPVARKAWEAKLGRSPTIKREFQIDLTCPFCGAQHVMAGDVEPGGREPADGDATLCIKCGEIAVFAKAAPGGARKPTIEELEAFGQDDNIQGLRRAWKKTMELEAAGPPNPSTPWGYH